jgi:hypothetical protein
VPTGTTARKSADVDDHPHGNNTALVLGGPARPAAGVAAQLQARGQATWSSRLGNPGAWHNDGRSTMAAQHRTTAETEIRQLIGRFQRAIQAKDLNRVLQVSVPIDMDSGKALLDLEPT